jgi:hypothetical protein
VTLTPELTLIQKMVHKLLRVIGPTLPQQFLVMDGKFGNINALQRSRQGSLYLISK